MGKKVFDPRHTRTFALKGHRSAGKTSLAEVLLQTTGATRTIGRVDDQSSLLDHHPAERRRGMSLQPAFAWMEWRDHLLHLVDLPGSDGLSHHRRLALAGVDAAVTVISAPDGIEYGTEQALEDAERLELPVLAVINHMDRVDDVDEVLADLEELTGIKVLPLQVPFFDGEGRYSGAVQLLQSDGELRVYRYDLQASGRFSPEPVPDRYLGPALEARERLAEMVALSDEALLERYLEYLELPVDVVREGLARLVQRREVIPVLFTSAGRAAGAHAVLDAAIHLLPSPLDRQPPVARTPEGDEVVVEPGGPFTAQVIGTLLDDDDEPYRVLRVWGGEPRRGAEWLEGDEGLTDRVRKLYQIRGPRRTTAVNLSAGSIVATWDLEAGRPGATWSHEERRILPVPAFDPPMLSWLLVPLTERDEQALPEALTTLRRLDAAVRVSTDQVTGHPILSGQGQIHLQHAVDLLRGRLGIRVDTRLPPVPYRETPLKVVRGARGLHRKHDGQMIAEFGECLLDVEPAEPADDLVFDAAVDPEALPERFQGPVGAGVRQAARRGPTAGYPVAGLRVRCVGGEYDYLFSEVEHFEQAGARALREALHRSGTALLEPWSRVRIETTSGDVGPVINELGSHRGRVVDLEVGHRKARIDAHVPFRELRTFAPRLQAVTGGRGRFRSRHSHYDRLPEELVGEAIAESPWRDLPEDAPSRPVGASNRGREPEYNA